jgi:hypothetical protein
MNTATATAALPHRPDPSPDQAPSPAPAPTRTGRLLGLIHKLVDYGKEVVQTLQGHFTPSSTHTDPATVKRNFGTLNAQLIIMRILRGLRLAAALETRLAAHPLHEEAAPAALVRAPSNPAPRTVKSAAPRASRAAPPPLSGVPTAEEIAAAVRVRPVGAVIADICRDLGIGQSHPLWGDVMMAVTEFGGNLVKLFNDMLDRLCSWFENPAAIVEQGWAAPWPKAAAGFGSGPH